MPEEAVFFGRSGLFGLVLAVAYWFVSYEVAGTLLLGGFGLATAAAFLLLARGARQEDDGSRPDPGQDGDRKAGTGSGTGSEAGKVAAGESNGDGPFADEGGLVALSSTAPLWVGLGLGVMSLGLGFGFWFVLAGLVPLGLGAGTWLAEVRREADRSGRRR